MHGRSPGPRERRVPRQVVVTEGEVSSPQEKIHQEDRQEGHTVPQITLKLRSEAHVKVGGDTLG